MAVVVAATAAAAAVGEVAEGCLCPLHLRHPPPYWEEGEWVAAEVVAVA